MGVGTTLGVIGAVGSIGGAAISANAAGNAASTQANAADYAANLQSQQAQQALGFNEAQYNNAQTEEAPYLQSGYSAEANLDNLLGILPPGTQANGQTPTTTAPANGLASGVNSAAPVVSGPRLSANSPDSNSLFGNTAATATTPATPAGAPGALVDPNVAQAQAPNLQSLVNPSLGAAGSLSAPWTGTFTAPTAAEAAATPGYQFALGQGEQAIQNSAAARGGLLSSGTAKALDAYATGQADTNYQNVYNNALTGYSTAYNTFENNQANLYNRLAGVAGTGQVTANNLANQGQAAANNNSNTLLQSGAQIGQNINNAGAATASGYVGQANAINQGIGSVSSLAQQLALIQALNGQGGAGSQSNLLQAGTPGVSY